MCLIAFLLLSGNESIVTPTYADLFFYAVDIQYDSNGGVTFFRGKCVLCGDVIKPFGNSVTKGGRCKWQRIPFLTHLKTKHAGVHKQLGVEIRDIRSVQNPKFKKPSSQPAIQSYYAVKRVSSDCEGRKDDEGAKRRDVVQPQCQPTTDLAFHIPRMLGKGSGYITLDCSDVLRTMRVIVSDISLSWNRRTAAADLYWSMQLATYEQSDRLIPQIYEDVRIMLKSLIPCFSSYSLSCDCWSSVSLRVKVICFFLHVYHQNKYKTLLLDVIPIDKGDALSIKSAFKALCDYYGLDESTVVTTDNASSNVRCFGAFQNECKAHGLNTACMHLVSDTKRATQKLFLNFDERRVIRAFFATVEGTCSTLRGSAFSSFVAWLEDNITSNPDLAGLEPTRPPKQCVTRWLGKIEYLKWLQQYGVAVYRFLVNTNTYGIDVVSLYNCLKQLPEVLAVMNVMNNALNLLTPNNCTAHLVLPIVYHMKSLLVDARIGMVHSIPKKMIDSIVFEIEKGCLCISPEKLPLYQCASACYPYLKFIAESLYKDCMDVAEEKYAAILKACSQETLNDLSLSRESFGGYTMTVVNSSKRSSIPGKDTIPNCLKYCKDGMSRIVLRGELGDCESNTVQTIIGMTEDDIEKKIALLKRRIKNKPKNSREFKQSVTELNTLLRWEDNGGSVDDESVDTVDTIDEQPNLLDGVKSLVTATKKGDVHSIPTDEESTRGRPTDPITVMKESYLHLSATEADCERFFRILSQLTKRPYLTNIGKDKVCRIGFLIYYAEEIFYSMADGTNKRDVYSIFYEGRA